MTTNEIPDIVVYLAFVVGATPLWFDLTGEFPITSIADGLFRIILSSVITYGLLRAYHRSERTTD